MHFCFLFLFCFVFFLSSRRVRFESVIALKYGTSFWLKTRYNLRHNTELKKSVVQSVSLCLSYLFLYTLASKFIKKTGKKFKQAKKKNSNLKFCWIKRTPKNKCALQLWDIRFIFLSLSWINQVFHINVWPCNCIIIEQSAYSTKSANTKLPKATYLQCEQPLYIKITCNQKHEYSQSEHSTNISTP